MFGKIDNQNTPAEFNQNYIARALEKRITEKFGDANFKISEDDFQSQEKTKNHIFTLTPDAISRILNIYIQQERVNFLDTYKGPVLDTINLDLNLNDFTLVYPGRDTFHYNAGDISSVTQLIKDISDLDFTPEGDPNLPIEEKEKINKKQEKVLSAAKNYSSDLDQNNKLKEAFKAICLVFNNGESIDTTSLLPFGYNDSTNNMIQKLKQVSINIPKKNEIAQSDKEGIVQKIQSNKNLVAAIMAAVLATGYYTVKGDNEKEVESGGYQQNIFEITENGVMFTGVPGDFVDSNSTEYYKSRTKLLDLAYEKILDGSKNLRSNDQDLDSALFDIIRDAFQETFPEKKGIPTIVSERPIRADDKTVTYEAGVLGAALTFQITILK